MVDFVVSATLIWLAATVCFAYSRRYGGRERSMVLLAFWLHVVAAFAHVIVTVEYFGGGDMLGYYDRGLTLAELVRTDLGYLPDVIAIAAKQSPSVPVYVFAMGSSTAALSGYAALALLAAVDSLWGACLLFSFSAFVGQLAIYNTVREGLPQVYWRRAAVAVFMIPSVLFWSSGMLKESIALAGLGLAFRGLKKMFVDAERPIFYGPMAALGLFIIYTAKAYVILPLFLSIAAWAYLRRIDQAALLTSLIRRPFSLAAITIVVIGGLYGFGKAFPEYSPADFETETARLQSLYYTQGSAGSTFRFEAEAPTSERQLYLAPLGLASALFRPLPFEVHNAVSLAEASLMLVLNILFVRLLLRRNRRHAAFVLKRSPMMISLLVFVVVFSTGVGLATPNLGSLSRYRILMLPFYGLLLAGLLPLGRNTARQGDARAVNAS